MTYPASDIARWFLNHAQKLSDGEDTESITNLKLQKLLYYAQGSSLALRDEPLFAEDILHWQHGPAVKEVYQMYASSRDNAVSFTEDFSCSLDAETDRLLEDVYSVFGLYSAWGLRRLSCQESPWKETELNEIISRKAIRKYFLENYVEAVN